MAEIVGEHSQIWCRSRFTHRLCNGYVFESAATLKGRQGLAIEVDLSALPSRIELLCSCSHHDRNDLWRSDPARFVVSARQTAHVFGTTVRAGERAREDSVIEEKIGLGAKADERT